MKICSTCREEKKDSEFYSSWNGKQYNCKECARAARRESYANSVRNIRPMHDINVGLATIKYEAG